LSAWDISAALLVLKEAGGTFSDYEGHSLTPAQLRRVRVVASNGYIHEDMLTVLREGENAPRPTAEKV
jgi:myo-inositol-1(or 4)-monophosphatase